MITTSSFKEEPELSYVTFCILKTVYKDDSVFQEMYQKIENFIDPNAFLWKLYIDNDLSPHPADELFNSAAGRLQELHEATLRDEKKVRVMTEIYQHQKSSEENREKFREDMGALQKSVKISLSDFLKEHGVNKEDVKSRINGAIRKIYDEKMCEYVNSDTKFRYGVSILNLRDKLGISIEEIKEIIKDIGIVNGATIDSYTQCVSLEEAGIGLKTHSGTWKDKADWLINEKDRFGISYDKTTFDFEKAYFMYVGALIVKEEDMLEEIRKSRACPFKLQTPRGAKIRIVEH